MARKLSYYIILSCITKVLTKDPEPELPPCPTNYQFLPQTLPMHCKMPSQAYPGPLPPPFPPQYTPYLSGQPDKPAAQPIDPKFLKPPATGSAFPAPMGQPFPMPMGQPMPMPMGMPGMPMGMPMMGGPPQSKLPVIVMPFYSPDPAYKDPRKDRRDDPRRPAHEPYKRKIRVIKKSRHRHIDTDRSSDETDTISSDTDSSDSDRQYWNWRNRRSMRRRKKIKHAKQQKQEYLTPILQYVSKDGYVIFEKKISKGEAKDWLGDNKGPDENSNEEAKGRRPNKESNRKQENEQEEYDPMPVEVVKQVKKNDAGVQEHNVIVKYTKNIQRRSRKQNKKPQQNPTEVKQKHEKQMS